MPMNPLPPTGGPGAAPAAASGPGRKEETASPDSGFTALLMALVGAQMMMPTAAPTAAPTPDQQQPAEEGAAAVMTAVVPATPASAPIPPQDLEALLVSQRVTLPQTAAVFEDVKPATEAPEETPQGVWVVQPLAAMEITVQTPTADTGPKDEQPTEAPALTLEAEVPHFAAVHTTAASQTEGVVSAAASKAPAPIPSPIEPDRLMDAIAKSAVSSSDGRYTVTLRLNPEQLGEVRLQLHVSGREVQTTLQVANPEARQLLEQRSDQLRDSLNQSGLTLSGFHVATGQEERRQDAREQFEQLVPRRRGRQSNGLSAIGGPATLPVRMPTPRRSTGFDTLA